MLQIFLRLCLSTAPPMYLNLPYSLIFLLAAGTLSETFFVFKSFVGFVLLFSLRFVRLYFYLSVRFT